MSSRYVSTVEINSILEIVEDNTGLELLQKIRDNLISEQSVNDKVKGFAKKEGKKPEQIEEERRKEDEERAFIGSTKEEDLDVEGKESILERLEGKGLILKGGYIPFGKERINSYKVTNEGYAVLGLIERIRNLDKGKGGGSNKSASKEPEKVPERRHR